MRRSLIDPLRALSAGIQVGCWAIAAGAAAVNSYQLFDIGSA
jgi:hypothetical protein